MSETCTSRLEPIIWLASQNGSELDLSALEAQEIRAKRIHDDYGMMPTIGCELEVKRSSLQPDLMTLYLGSQNEFGEFERAFSDLSPEQRQQFDNGCAVFDHLNLPRYQAAQAAGIPKGTDALWEFANAPTYSWKTLATEVALLFSSRLIPEGYNHSLHVTLGGVGTTGGGMALILSGLELAYVSPARIRVATNANRHGALNAWARRGEDGMKERSPSELGLGHTVGTEFRTLEAASGEKASRILYTAQLLSAILSAYRIRQSTTSDEVIEVAKLWPQYRIAIKELWLMRGLPVESWGVPHRHPQSWLGWAACLEARTQADGPEYNVVQEMQKVTNTANTILELL